MKRCGQTVTDHFFWLQICKSRVKLFELIKVIENRLLSVAVGFNSFRCRRRSLAVGLPNDNGLGLLLQLLLAVGVRAIAAAALRTGLMLRLLPVRTGGPCTVCR